jgi:hypothetical protein
MDYDYFKIQKLSKCNSINITKMKRSTLMRNIVWLVFEIINLKYVHGLISIKKAYMHIPPKFLHFRNISKPPIIVFDFIA